MAEPFDVVVAGAGHNSLVSAAYLARAGLRCLVLEAREAVGGNTSSEALTLPGFRHDTCSTAHNLIQASPMLAASELPLERYGLTYLQPDPVVHLPFPDGAWLTQWRDRERTWEEFARFSRRDADAYLKLLDDYEPVAPLFGRWRNTPIGWGPSLPELLAGHPDGARWLRRHAMSAWDVVRDTFADEHTRAFMLWMSFMTVQPVDRPGTGPLAYSLTYGRQRHSWTLPRGGSAALPQALTRYIEANGGTILTGQPVTGLILEGGRCAGVETATGDRHRAGRAVLSTIHIKHLVEMAPAAAWGADFRWAVDTWRPGVSMFVAHYATTEPPRYAVDGGTVTPVASGTPQSVERLLRLGSEHASGVVETTDPVLLVLAPTVTDPGRAPDGHHTLKVVGFQPYELPGGPRRWDSLAGDVAAANLEALRRHAPNLTSDKILAGVVKSPLDLERFNAHNWHGSCHGGDAGPSQSGALRPAHGFADHRTPIPGLYQTGATTHPGGSVSAAPGRNAAMVMLRDLGLPFSGNGARG